MSTSHLSHTGLVYLFALFFLSACSYHHLPSAASSPPIKKPSNITLFVPLQGPNGESGQAIRNGFLSAYYNAKQTTLNAPSINIIDSSRGNIAVLYAQAVEKGTDFVVGPLTKKAVQTLMQQPILVPTIALNTIENRSSSGYFYQFGLSPQDEVEQVLIRAKKEGHTRAFLVIPPGEWGDNIARRFETKWAQSGGMITHRLTYPALGNSAAALQNAFRNQSTAQTDIIFLVATPQAARQMKPLLNFYAPHVPIYATSLIYAGTFSVRDQDLNGVIFDDMPWIIGPDNPTWDAMRHQIKTLWDRSYVRSPRLYALGIDAYYLTQTFDQLKSGVAGATGILHVDENHRIHRILNWAQFHNGAPSLLP